MRYTLARGLSEVAEKPDVILVGNGRRLVYRRGGATPPRVVNQKEIKFTEVSLLRRNILLVDTRVEQVQQRDGIDFKILFLFFYFYFRSFRSIVLTFCLLDFLITLSFTSVFPH